VLADRPPIDRLGDAAACALVFAFPAVRDFLCVVFVLDTGGS
jgi:hypothetical protein